MDELVEKSLAERFRPALDSCARRAVPGARLYELPVAVEARNNEQAFGNALRAPTADAACQIERGVATMKTFAGFLVGMAGLALAVSSGAAVAATECNTGPPGNPPLSGTVVGGLVVNAGDFCILGGATISGGVQINAGGILIACGSTINGGIVANGAGSVLVGPEEIDCAGGIINGAVQISNTGPSILPGGAPSIALERSTINGAVRLTGNRGPIAVASNRIAGGLFCANNTFNVDNEGLSNVITGAITCKFD